MDAARDWMTVNEAAERMGLSPWTVRRLLTSRKLGHRKVGPNQGIYQITETHVQEYLEACEVKTRTDKPAEIKSKNPKSSSGLRGRAGTVERLDGSPPKYY